MKRTVLAAAAACVVASGAMTSQAPAADRSYMPAPPRSMPTWKGFYVGGHIGFGEAEVEGAGTADLGTDFDDEGFFEDAGLDFEEGVLTIFRTTLKPDWLIGGAQAGYNWQAASLVFGIEGDVSFADWSHSTDIFDTDDGDLGGPYDEYAFANASAEVDMLASVRGRLGYAFDSVLVYGTGGVAWADATARGRIVVSDFDDPAVEDETFISNDKDFSDIGFVVGGGMAWMVIPQTFSVGVEGLYYFFDQDETLFEGTFARNTDGIAGDDLELEARATASLNDAWVIRARADFHF